MHETHGAQSNTDHRWEVEYEEIDMSIHVSDDEEGVSAPLKLLEADARALAETLNKAMEAGEVNLKRLRAGRLN